MHGFLLGSSSCSGSFCGRLQFSGSSIVHVAKAGQREWTRSRDAGTYLLLVIIAITGVRIVVHVGLAEGHSARQIWLGGLLHKCSIAQARLTRDPRPVGSIGLELVMARARHADQEAFQLLALAAMLRFLRIIRLIVGGRVAGTAAQPATFDGLLQQRLEQICRGQLALPRQDNK